MGYELYNLPFYNNSGETVPAFAVLQVDNWKDDVNARDYFRIKKPDGTGKVYLVNGPITVPAAGDGMASRAPGIQASYYAGDGTPANGEEWGPNSGEWVLRKGYAGFDIIGDSEIKGGVYTIRVSVQSGASTLQHGKATTAITAATGQAAANWGSGTVQFWDAEGVNDGAAVTVDNSSPASFISGAWVTCDRSTTPPRIVSGTCEAVGGA